MPTGGDAPPSRRAALQVRDLRVSYGSTTAVDGIALEVEEGEIFGLLGPNGAGKTSALSAIEGLVHPDEGSIIVVDVDARSWSGETWAALLVSLGYSAVRGCWHSLVQMDSSLAAHG